MDKTEPLIWVLCGVRAGDTAQALELARRVGGRVEEKQLSFNALHHLPNVLQPVGLHSLTPQARKQLAAPWPDLVIATGKRTAPIARSIRVLSGGAAKIVQMGRPRSALKHFDLVITTLQYGLPPCSNVITLMTPFAAPKPVDDLTRAKWLSAWQHVPRPWIMAAIGASKYPLRLGTHELDAYGAALNEAARKLHAHVILFDSPRSAQGAAARVQLQIEHGSLIPNGAGAYATALGNADFYAVTGDSVSMASEMLATRKPVAVFRLPRVAGFTWSAEAGVGAALARSGILSPPRDVDGWMAALVGEKRLGLLGQSWGTAGHDGSAQNEAVARVRRLTGLA